MTDSGRQAYFFHEKFQDFNQLTEIQRRLSSEITNPRIFSHLVARQKDVEQYFDFFENKLEPFISVPDKDYSLILDGKYYEVSERESHSANISKKILFSGREKNPCQIFLSFGINPYSYERISKGIREHYCHENLIYSHEVSEYYKEKILLKIPLIPSDLNQFKQSLERFVYD